MLREWTRGSYRITTDRARVDLDAVHRFLTSSYWAEGRSRDRVARSIDHSIPFSLFHDDEQVGFARVVTDFVVIAHVADVFVVESHRGHGLGRWLMEAMTQAPELQHIRRWVLATRDAHGLYRQFGFIEANSQVMMERVDRESDRHPLIR